jgi:formylglycine-generating enzyme required for sulfatase activity
MQKSKQREDTKESQIVQLKPILGIPPKRYIGFLYAFALILILFFLFLFPGMYRGGAVVSFQTFPQGASVYVDNVRIGTSPLEVFIKRGTHELTIKKSGFTSHQESRIVPRRLVGSLFFPKRIEIHTTLILEDPERILSQAYRTLSSWVLTGGPTPLYPFPPILTTAIRDIYQSEGPKKGSKEILEQFLIECASQIASEGMFPDYLKALTLTQSEGFVLNHRSLIESLRFFSSLIENYPASRYWFASILPSSTVATFTDAEIVSKQLEELVADLKGKIDPPPLLRNPQKPLYLENWEFIPIPEGSFYMGWAGINDPSNIKDTLELPHRVTVSSFYLRSTEVTEGDFLRFIQENPRWSPAERKTLMDEGLVNEYYLLSWNNLNEAPNPSYPVREVSYFAAKAYCAWLEEKFPAYRFGLPTEAEWEWAASLDFISEIQSFSGEIHPVQLGSKGRLGLRFLLGNVWEWTEDWFAPAAYLFPGVLQREGAERVVRGGSYVNTSESITVSTRGAQPPSWCTPYLGFRIKAVPRN